MRFRVLVLCIRASWLWTKLLEPEVTATYQVSQVIFTSPPLSSTRKRQFRVQPGPWTVYVTTSSQQIPGLDSFRYKINPQMPALSCALKHFINWFEIEKVSVPCRLAGWWIVRAAATIIAATLNGWSLCKALMALLKLSRIMWRTAVVKC